MIYYGQEPGQLVEAPHPGKLIFTGAVLAFGIWWIFGGGLGRLLR